MVSRSVSRLMIVGGVIGVCGAGLWWREFYSEVGRFIGSDELPIECLYALGGACGLISDAASVVTSSAYKPFLFWISGAVLLTGIVLEGFPSGERNDVFLTRERDRDYRPLDQDDRQDPYLQGSIGNPTSLGYINPIRMEDGMVDAATTMVPGVLSGMVQRDGERHGAIQAEIERNGTAWAADEIDRLRHKISSLQARLTASEGRDR